MIISEKQIMQLINVVQLYSREIRITQPELAKEMDKFINEIFTQQSEELKEIK